MSTGSGQDGRVIPFGRYELLELIAAGGMGEIYLARTRGVADFEKRCVIKKILPHLAGEEEFVHKFIDEAKLVVQLTHGNIVPVFDMGEEQGEFYIAMDYIQGRDLRGILKSLRATGARMPVPVAVQIAAEVCKGLAYAHRKADDQERPLGIIHRDVSPSNILISREGEVKIVDFGIAKAASRSTRSITGRVQGKFGYMSPEQARGASLDPRSDLFSTGVVLFEMLTGTRPFDGTTDLDSLERVKSHIPPPVSQLRDGIPDRLDKLVARVLSKAPEARFPTADEFLKELLACQAERNAGVTQLDVADALKEALHQGDPPPGKGFGALLEEDLLHAGSVSAMTMTATASINDLPAGSGAGLRPSQLTPSVSDVQSPPYGLTPATGPYTPAHPLTDPNAQTQPPQPPARRSRLLALALILLGLAIGARVTTLLMDTPQEAAPPAPAAAATTPDTEEDVQPIGPHDHVVRFEVGEATLKLTPPGAWKEQGALQYAMRTEGRVQVELSQPGHLDCSFQLNTQALNGENPLIPLPSKNKCKAKVLGSARPDGELYILATLAEVPVVAVVEDVVEDVAPEIEEIEEVKEPPVEKRHRGPKKMTLRVTTSDDPQQVTVSGPGFTYTNQATPFVKEIDRVDEKVKVVVLRDSSYPVKRSFVPKKEGAEKHIEVDYETWGFAEVMVRAPGVVGNARADILIRGKKVSTTGKLRDYLMPPGKHDVVATFKDKEQASGTLEIVSGKTDSLVLTLKPKE